MQPNPNSPGYSLTAKELPELLLRIIRSEVSVHHLAEVLRLSQAHGMGGVQVRPGGTSGWRISNHFPVQTQGTPEIQTKLRTRHILLRVIHD